MTSFKRYGRAILFPVIVSLISATLLAAQDASQRILIEHLQRASAAHSRMDYANYLYEMKQVLEVRPNQPAYMYHLAGAFALAGDRTDALNWLRRVAEMGMVYPAAGDADLNSLKDSEEFSAILKLFDQNRAP